MNSHEKEVVKSGLNKLGLLTFSIVSLGMAVPIILDHFKVRTPDPEKEIREKIATTNTVVKTNIHRVLGFP